MSNPRWYSGYVDRLTVQMRIVEHPSEAPEEVWVFTADAIAPPDLDDLLDALLAELQQEDGFPPPYAANLQKGVRSWGASGASAQLVVELGNKILQGAAAAGGAALFVKIKGRIATAIQNANEERHASSGLILRSPLGIDEATSRAKWQVTQTYSLPESLRLERVGDSHGASGWTITLRDTNGSVYEVQMDESEGLVSIDLIRRQLAPDSGMRPRERPV